MQTEILHENDIQRAADILNSGGLVAIPTETVYGLAADALNGQAVAKIFKAKGRPMDNPLIVHISSIEEIYRLVSKFPDKAKVLANKFWPGPLTMILPKSDIIPDEVSAGLNTVAVRLPSHKIAREVIKESGKPLAAPSANLSGSPSPTTAEHVINDMFGRIDAIIDGGKCEVGLESTVITLATDTPRLLRPGGVTVEQLRDAIGQVDIDDAVFNKLKETDVAASPGMKYKHYAPKARVIILRGNSDKYAEYVNNHNSDTTAALCYEEDKDKLTVPVFTYGSKSDYSKQAQALFDALREIDKTDIKLVYARCPEPIGVGMAVYNRLIRAAGFEMIDIG